MDTPRPSPRANWTCRAPLAGPRRAALDHRARYVRHNSRSAASPPLPRRASAALRWTRCARSWFLTRLSGASENRLCLQGEARRLLAMQPRGRLTLAAPAPDPPPLPRTNRTSLVRHPVLTRHVAPDELASLCLTDAEGEVGRLLPRNEARAARWALWLIGVVEGQMAVPTPHPSDTPRLPRACPISTG